MALGEALRKEETLRKLWDVVQREYLRPTQSQHIRTYEEFKENIKRRVTLNDGFQNTKYVDGPGVIHPLDGSKEVPKADVIIMHEPHLQDETGLLSWVGRPALGVWEMIRGQVKQKTGLVWVTSESPALRLGLEYDLVPKIEAPTSLTNFDVESGLDVHKYRAGMGRLMTKETSFFVP